MYRVPCVCACVHAHTRASASAYITHITRTFLFTYVSTSMYRCGILVLGLLVWVLGLASWMWGFAIWRGDPPYCARYCVRVRVRVLSCGLWQQQQRRQAMCHLYLPICHIICSLLFPSLFTFKFLTAAQAQAQVQASIFYLVCVSVCVCSDR